LNCSAVRMRWCSAHKHLMLSSVSVPPRARGLMWSGVTAARTLPCSLQSRHSGSAYNLCLRSSIPLRPRMRSPIQCFLAHLVEHGRPCCAHPPLSRGFLLFRCQLARNRWRHGPHSVVSRRSLPLGKCERAAPGRANWPECNSASETRRCRRRKSPE
jgi:hypothetical protein